MPVEELELNGAAEEVATPVEEAQEPAAPEELEPVKGEEPAGAEEPAAKEEAAPEGDEPLEAPAEAQAPAPDGRTLPDDVKKAIKGIQEASPQAAGKLRDSYFQNQAYQKVFPSVAEAQAAKDFLEVSGGDKGFKAIRSELENWNQTAQLFASGSPEFARDLQQANPEAFGQTVLNSVSLLEKTNPEQHALLASNLAASSLMSQPGVEAGLGTLQELYNALQNPEWITQSGTQAVPYITHAIASVINGVVGLRDKASEFQAQAQTRQPKTNPEQEKWLKEKEQWESKRQQEFEDDSAAKVSALMDEEAKPWLAPHAATLEAYPERVQTAFRAELRAEIAERLSKLPGFADRSAGYESAMDSKSLLGLYQRDVAKVIQGATTEVLGRYTRGAKPVTRTAPIARPATPARPAAPQQRSSGPLKLSEAPNPNTLDKFDGWDQQFVLGRGKQQGREVTW